MNSRNLAVFCLWALLLFGTTASSQDLDDTLRKIQSSQTVTFGFHPQSFPLSYLDDQKVAVGYTQDLSVHIASRVKQHLKLNKLEVRRTPITSQNRFDYVARGVVDLECTGTSNTKERQRQFAFSNSFFVANTKLLTHKESGIKDFHALCGRRVLAFASTTTEQLLKEFSSQRNVFFETILSTDLNAPPMTLLQSGQVDAYVGDDIMLFGHIANSARPREWIVTGTPLSREAYGCLLRKDSPVFKSVVDAAIADWMRSGKAALSYKKWFQSPVPPAGVNLKFPMSSDMEFLFRHPNDRSFD